jgi:Na+-translocating ferredoxin:NAD+ oxidoreductase RnfD subunit
VKRFHICATYVVSFLAFAFLRTLIVGDSFQAEAAPITGPMYQLFIFFMITDPKTTVKSKTGQIATTFCIALVECVFRLMDRVTGFPVVIAVNAPFFALFLVGPIANLIEIYRGGRKKAIGSAAPRGLGWEPSAKVEGR